MPLRASNLAKDCFCGSGSAWPTRTTGCCELNVASDKCACIFMVTALVECSRHSYMLSISQQQNSICEAKVFGCMSMLVQGAPVLTAGADEWTADAVSEYRTAMHLVQLQDKHASQNWHAYLALSITSMPGCSHEQCCYSCAGLGCMQLCLKLLPACLQMQLLVTQSQLSTHLMPPADPAQASQQGFESLGTDAAGCWKCAACKALIDGGCADICCLNLTKMLFGEDNRTIRSSSCEINAATSLVYKHVAALAACLVPEALVCNGPQRLDVCRL